MAVLKRLNTREATVLIVTVHFIGYVKKLCENLPSTA